MSNHFLTERFQKKMNLLTSFPLREGNCLTLLEDGHKAFPEILAALREAQETIYLEFYIINNDETGSIVARELIKKAKQGLQVLLAYDALGSYYTPSSFFNNLEKNGVKILKFNPLTFRSFPTKWHHRDHRKILIIDGKVGFVGGLNIGDEYRKGRLKRKKKYRRRWRDTHLKVEGPAVGDLQKLFIYLWTKNDHKARHENFKEPVLKLAGRSLARVVGSGPDIQKEEIYNSYLLAFRNAREKIYITDAYFIPSLKILKALYAAAERGVDVRLILPGISDINTIKYVSRFYYQHLLKKGIKIYERRGTVLHAKTAVIDGIWSTVGSANINHRSFHLNYEVNVNVVDRNFAHQMEEMFERDLALSEEIRARKWSRRVWKERVLERIAVFFEKYL